MNNNILFSFEQKDTLEYARVNGRDGKVRFHDAHNGKFKKVDAWDTCTTTEFRSNINIINPSINAFDITWKNDQTFGFNYDVNKDGIALGAQYHAGSVILYENKQFRANVLAKEVFGIVSEEPLMVYFSNYKLHSVYVEPMNANINGTFNISDASVEVTANAYTQLVLRFQDQDKILDFKLNGGFDYSGSIKLKEAVKSGNIYSILKFARGFNVSLSYTHDIDNTLKSLLSSKESFKIVLSSIVIDKMKKAKLNSITEDTNTTNTNYTNILLTEKELFSNILKESNQEMKDFLNEENIIYDEIISNSIQNDLETNVNLTNIIINNTNKKNKEKNQERMEKASYILDKFNYNFSMIVSYFPNNKPLTIISNTLIHFNNCAKKCIELNKIIISENGFQWNSIQNIGISIDVIGSAINIILYLFSLTNSPSTDYYMEGLQIINKNINILHNEMRTSFYEISKQLHSIYEINEYIMKQNDYTHEILYNIYNLQYNTHNIIENINNTIKDQQSAIVKIMENQNGISETLINISKNNINIITEHESYLTKLIIYLIESYQKIFLFNNLSIYDISNLYLIKKYMNENLKIQFYECNSCSVTSMYPLNDNKCGITAIDAYMYIIANFSEQLKSNNNNNNINNNIIIHRNKEINNLQNIYKNTKQFIKCIFYSEDLWCILLNNYQLQ